MKEFFKAVLSRKFAIAFVGIIALCYIANIQSKQLPAEDGIISFISDPNETDENLSKAGSIDWRIPTYIVFLAVWTVGVQGYLDYCKFKLNQNKAEQKPEVPEE